MFPKNHAVVADMTALHHIHEPGILYNLKERSRPWRQTPYTFMVSSCSAGSGIRGVSFSVSYSIVALQLPYNLTPEKHFTSSGILSVGAMDYLAFI